MKRISAAIEHGVRNAKVNASSPKGECITKLIVRGDGAADQDRGHAGTARVCLRTRSQVVSARVEEEFGFAEIPVVSFADLYAGKIVLRSIASIRAICLMSGFVL